MNSVRNRLEEVTVMLTQFRSLVDSHMVNFFTHNLWEKNVPVGIKNEVKSVPLNTVLQAFWDPEIHRRPSTNCLEITRYINQVRSLYLSSFENLLDLNQLKMLMHGWGCADCSIKLDQTFMSLKKSHEVEVMSGIIASLSRALKCSHIVDIGGGKGYLSSVLCLQHKFKVLGLDSSSSNTHTATRRTEKMLKVWGGVRRRIEEGGTYKKKGKNWKSKVSNINCIGASEEKYVERKSDNSRLNDNVNNNTDSVNQENRYHMNSNRNLLLNNNFKQATHYVNRNTRLSDVIDDCFPNDETMNLALIGLHTCGDLGASCLRLFVDNISTGLVDLLVNVGCCYHLMTEKYPGVPSVKESVCANNLPSADSGFPMSDYLCSKRFSLSYNSRVLSAQPVERISEENKMPSEMLFYRALLEVLLQRCTDDSKRETSAEDKDLYCVGRIKCTTFPEYVDKAVKKLGLQLQVSETELVQLYKDYEKYKNQLYTYFMMRVTLAPLVEATILLDRLLYLYENGVKDAHLVKLFDPLLSPRCYGILAFRNLHGHND